MVGFATLEHRSDSRVELGHLFVEPSAIGKGYRRGLLAHAVESARDRGYQTLEIQADPNAEQFYRASGARCIGVKRSASVPGRKLPLMELDLRDRDLSTSSALNSE